MLLTLTNTQTPATDLGFLLHKHPDRMQRYSLSFGTTHVFYPEAGEACCTACLLVEVDPIDLVRGKSRTSGGLLNQYVNDRPYVASSFLAVAIRQVFSTALGGRCAARPELVTQPLPLTAHLPVTPARGDENLVSALFEPLGYEVETVRLPLDERFPDWGDSPYVSLTLSAMVTVKDLLSHLYVLLPVLDNAKHYWVGQDELEKLLRHGADWLANHPDKGRIARRYLRHKWSLAREALARLEIVEDDSPEATPDETDSAEDALTGPDLVSITAEEAAVEAPLSLNEARIRTVMAELEAARVETVIDLGCGDGKLLSRLLRNRRFTRLVGLDVSIRALEIAADRLRLDRLPLRLREQVQLLHGGLTYRDARIEGFDAATAVEVIEHLDENRLAAFERVLFQCARPRVVIVTTPNVEYNVNYEFLPPGRLRHSDHRFEWTRAQFAAWGERVAATFGYAVRFAPVGPMDPATGPPTQMAVFARNGATEDGA
ncbi:MAG: 3' terminal RNA ribose 2'-O-methyltransferase Hen1 [Candidatus Contendobacter sp.]|nr:3' terminal RNA ribose 2'-O-methyltransferase Hen1 [Candidatus Contendobacter sp.]